MTDPLFPILDPVEKTDEEFVRLFHSTLSVCWTEDAELEVVDADHSAPNSASDVVGHMGGVSETQTPGQKTIEAFYARLSTCWTENADFKNQEPERKQGGRRYNIYTKYIG
jgi:hypothetical protein